MIAQNPRNGWVYATDLGADLIVTYKPNAALGQLTKMAEFKATPGNGPRHIAFHPSLPMLYVLNELAGTIDVLAENYATGQLTQLATVPTNDATNPLDAGSADIHITPDGRFLYATNRGKFNHIAQFIVAPDGQLTPNGHVTSGGERPRNFVIDPSGTWLLVANQSSDNVLAYRIDPLTGKLSGGIESKLPTPVCLQFITK